MPSTIPRVRRTVAASLGVVLLAAAVLTPFGTVVWTYEYDVERVVPDDPGLASTLAWPDTTAGCSRTHDACALAYRVRDDGPRVVSDEAYRAAYGFGPEKRLVIFRDADPAFYRTNVTYYENDTARISLRPVTNATALRLASTPADRFPRGVQRVVREGRVRSAYPLTGFALWDHTHTIVAYGGVYYVQDSFTYRGSMKHVVELLRLGVIAVGAALCYWVGRTGGSRPGGT